MGKCDFLICVLYICFCIVGLTLIKIGVAKDNGLFFIMSYPVSKELIAGVVFYGISFLIYTFVISQMQISIVLPLVSGINSILVVLTGIIVFKEILSFGQGVGIAVVIAGIVIVGFSTK